ncbi:hypothetical protein EJA05_11045 [Pseudomonas oryziphila]|uniref:Uncharacterized protein n=1 Tax=Pseudomonas entomophila TaxID=312306 RepID=A0A3Q8U4F6_9PSED|nr:hypothetical protein EJA05_11045 [Pseudomonas oryziphila]
MGAGLPAKQATRRVAQASPVFAAVRRLDKPAPTEITSGMTVSYGSEVDTRHGLPSTQSCLSPRTAKGKNKTQ